MPPAARVGDLHVCPMVTVLVPHVGGPILPPGAPTVMIGFMPAATATGMCTCVGPPDVIAKGSATVKINFLPAARMGDTCAWRNNNCRFPASHDRRLTLFHFFPRFDRSCPRT